MQRMKPATEEKAYIGAKADPVKSTLGASVVLGFVRTVLLTFWKEDIISLDREDKSRSREALH